MRSKKAIALRQKHMAGCLNGWQVYDATIKQYLRDGMTVLDVGCGKGLAGPFPWHEYPGVHLIGLDPDPAAQQNPALGQFILLRDDGAWPVPDGSVDLTVCRSVLEHIANPDQFMADLRRVLRPGGVAVLMAANSRHPVLILSKLLPHRVKARLLRWSAGRDESDTFPTYYRMNTPGRLKQLAQAQGLDILKVEAREFTPINYLDFTVAGYWWSYFWWRVFQKTGLERRYGAHVLAVLQRPVEVRASADKGEVA